MTLEDDYPCVGVCMLDAETGYCLGCGRPPSTEPLMPVQMNVEPSLEAAQVARSDDREKPG